MMALALGLAALCSTAAFAQDVTDPALNGVTRSFIEANGYPAALTLSARGVNHLGQAQIPLSGFDIVNDGTTGELLLPGVRKLPNGSCNGLTDDAYFLIHVAGRPGDADGDGAFNNNTGVCSHLAPGNTTIDDGNGDGDTRLLSDGETIEIRVDRKCAGSGAFDLAFFLSSPSTTTTLRVSRDFLTGHLNDNLGGDGVAWAAGKFPDVAYLTCPNSNDGYYIVRIPNWSKYFTAIGLNPGDFKWEVHVGSSNDVVQEDVVAGAVQLSQPKLTITKTPDLTLCPGDQGTYTIHVSNDGNATVHSVVVTDVLPAGASIVSSSIPASGSTGTVTFQVGDLAQCGSTDITVTVKASDTCHGHDVNTASAAGSWASFCAFGNIDSQPVFSNTATANFDCKAKACVTFTTNPVGPLCEGDKVTISGTVTNCTDPPTSEDVIVTINGTPHDLGQLGAGAHDFSFDLGALVCVNGGADYKVDVSATTDCPPASTPAEQIVHVACKVKPCVTFTVKPVGPLCEGDNVTIAGTVTNCTTNPAGSEDVIVTINGTPHDLGQVPPGTQDFSFDLGALVCVNGGADYKVDVSATAECLPASTPAEQTVHVACKVKPCVTFTVKPVGPLCEGDNVTIAGTVTNCTSNPAGSEDVIVTINGTPHDLGQLSPGAHDFSFDLGALVCVNGGADYKVDVSATAECPPVSTPDEQIVHVVCSPKPCVTLTINPLSPQCAGTPVNVTGTVNNCSDGPETIVISIPGVPNTTFNAVPAKDERPFSIPVGNLVCTNGSAIYHVTATASTSCLPNDVKEGDATILCEVPKIAVVKTGPSSVNNGDTIHYVITVSNPSADVDLETVTVTDQLCNYVSNPRNFAGTCTAGAPQVNGKVISWPTFSLPKNGSCTITFDVTADVAAGGAQCPTSVSCPNLVHVFGFCAGSNGASRVDAEFTLPTTIQCLVLNCPRTPGFWNAQCAQKLNGSTKYSKDAVTTIASCVDDHSTFFNWASGTDFDQFCRVITPPKPMDQRKQAKRQFATLLANLCASSLNLQPVRGGKITLDPSTPVNCGGLQATTIGELITEVDNLLASLEGQSLNNGDVKAKYGAIISCIDAINNGISIPVTPDCEDGGTAPTSDSTLDPATDAASPMSSAIELYRAFPNPFAGSTSFSYEVSGTGEAPVDITVFNVAGRQVRKLVSSTQGVGLHSTIWDGRSDAGALVPRGIYFVRTSIGGTRENTMRVIYLP